MNQCKKINLSVNYQPAAGTLPLLLCQFTLRFNEPMCACRGNHGNTMAQTCRFHNLFFPLETILLPDQKKDVLTVKV